MAGGMAWGIRGQYGHETGAMIAGLLVSWVLVFLLAPHLEVPTAVRAVAMGTIAMGFGGSMTYGQTIGLTQDPALIRNWEALRWGMLGLGIKGAIWIGFAGLFLGMGLGGVRYRFWDIVWIMTLSLGLYWLGRQLLNEPYDPEHRILPRFYLSQDWRWHAWAEVKPRREVWGGLLFALLGLTGLVAVWKRERLGCRLAAWGFLGGAIGFPLGQCIQAGHAWAKPLFRGGFLGQIEPYVNWWNMMETTFGTVMGAFLGLGLWWHRRLIAEPAGPPRQELPVWLEWLLLPPYLAVLVTVQFKSVPLIDRLFDLGLALGFLPMVLSVTGTRWPSLVVFPITLLPIAGITIQQLAYDEKVIPPAMAALCYGLLPLALVIAAAWHAATPAVQAGGARPLARRSLVLSVWIYYALNFAFFHYPWPWAHWTTRTPNAMIFLIDAVSLTLIAWFVRDTLAQTEPAKEAQRA